MLEPGQASEGEIGRRCGGEADCDPCPLRAIVLGPMRDAQALQRLDQRTSIQSYERDALVVASGARQRELSVVARGVLRLTRSFAARRRQITDFLYPGDLVCHGDAQAVMSADVEAVVPSLLCSLSAPALEQARGDDPTIDQRLLAVLQDRLERAQSHISTLGIRGPLGRLAAFLLDMDRRCSSDREPDDAMPIPMRRGEIADYLGLQTETVSRAFSKLVALDTIALPRPTAVVLLRRNVLQGLTDGLTVSEVRQPSRSVPSEEPCRAA